LIERQFFHFIDAGFFHPEYIDEYEDKKCYEDELRHYRIDGDTINLFSVLFNEFEHG
jgi:hypothetical protein